MWTKEEVIIQLEELKMSEHYARNLGFSESTDWHGRNEAAIEAAIVML